MKRLFTLLLGLAALGVSGSASAIPAIFGAGSWSTARNCAGAASTDPCFGAPAGPGQQIFAQDKHGGAGVAVSTSSLTLADGSNAHSTAGFGALDMPEIHGDASASANRRMNSNSFAYQSFVYNGTTGTPFALDGLVTFTTSGRLGLAEMAGEGGVNSYLAIWDISTVAGIVSVDDLFSNLFYADCGVPGVIAASGLSSAGGAGGAGGFTVKLDRDCAGNALSLTNGSTFLIVAGMQTPANRGGFADASHTFVVGLSDTLSAETRENLANNLSSGLDAAVPEPATLGLFGAGVVGLAARRRRR